MEGKKELKNLQIYIEKSIYYYYFFFQNSSVNLEGFFDCGKLEVLIRCNKATKEALKPLLLIQQENTRDFRNTKNGIHNAAQQLRTQILTRASRTCHSHMRGCAISSLGMK